MAICQMVMGSLCIIFDTVLVSMARTGHGNDINIIGSGIWTGVPVSLASYSILSLNLSLAYVTWWFSLLGVDHWSFWMGVRHAEQKAMGRQCQCYCRHHVAVMSTSRQHCSEWFHVCRSSLTWCWTSSLYPSSYLTWLDSPPLPSLLLLVCTARTSRPARTDHATRTISAMWWELSLCSYGVTLFLCLWGSSKWWDHWQELIEVMRSRATAHWCPMALLLLTRSCSVTMSSVCQNFIFLQKLNGELKMK